MPTGSLIDRLARELRPVRRRAPWREAALLLGLGAIELGLFLGLGLMRPDMTAAMQLPVFWWKLASLGLIGLVGGAVTLFSLDPVRSPRPGLRWLAVLIAVCLGGGWLLDASREGLAALVGRLDWHHGLQCLGKIVALSVPAVIALGVVMRRGAPTDRAGTALAAGLAASGWGAFVFVFACPFDDPLYVAVWYSLGCGVVTLFARLVLPRLARW
ncbi:DUF1109 domain-containing protein [Rhodovastum atsumiense]|uniref:DUF1109 domain-containing protein n=1 Tax=Rhodovastum atsumiense TaxID=504468 RepID=A0A5M6IS29_9PROT|nr:DUF1109 domain-containing protein [Rhodovastum atsumiense]